MSTPYIVVEVNKQDFDAFTQPYTDGQGNEFTFTSKETYRIAELLIDYILHEVTRPANVKVIMIVSKTELDDSVGVSETLSQTSTAAPDIISDTIAVTETTEHPLNLPISFTVGMHGLTVGAPTIGLINSLSHVDAPTVGQFGMYDEYAPDGRSFSYSVLPSSGSFLSGFYYSVPFHVRTPSVVSITTNVTATILGQTNIGGAFITLGTVPANQTYVYRTYDVQYLKIRTTVQQSGISVSVTWETQLDNTQQQSTNKLVKIN
jgi:hypothetical protein